MGCPLKKELYSNATCVDGGRLLKMFVSLYLTSISTFIDLCSDDAALVVVIFFSHYFCNFAYAKLVNNMLSVLRCMFFQHLFCLKLRFLSVASVSFIKIYQHTNDS